MDTIVLCFQTLGLKIENCITLLGKSFKYKRIFKLLLTLCYDV